ncbi:S-adenosyl-L-methionine:benzoic acid/salicylic acid carboxyl methyltransferase 3 [Ricinus communis]|uniref:Benzoate carboxyl methyltransferase, putative n=1 Tax=Ricinus communis TaxID=3988 RepID=B9STC2_RICCO|nr:S-adenosyl-L-methionine:benzoic acid/salicylic acid carboxyl methyltransferase 3 [Ricinus communis]EEF33154.1 Benzoate carboxyl methyltransferase, putative [Ricinus communis]|eukprot:XP_002529241.1 salicylate carboxymethyltransferase [Ricinus communis]
MEVVRERHMNGGTGENSYAQNSLLQQKVISMTKPIIEKAMANLYCSSFPESIAIADFGCSSGPNTLITISEIIKAAENNCRKLGRRSPEYHVFFNDLPSNDFNTIFRSLPSFQEKLKQQSIGPCFFYGIPGSFYGRLLPRNSLQFAYSSCSLHWLSQVPEGLESNNGKIHMSNTSPPSVLKAYYAQFQTDFITFLKCRSEELIPGGHMVWTMTGRRSKDPSSKDDYYLWELLAMTLNQLVLEGAIDKEKFDSFNIPQYTPSIFEVISKIEEEGSFLIDQLEVYEQHWNAYHDEPNLSEDFKDPGYNVAKFARAVSEPLIISHFCLDKAIMDKIFDRYRTMLNDYMAKEKTKFVNLIVSVVKKEI